MLSKRRLSPASFKLPPLKELGGVRCLDWGYVGLGELAGFQQAKRKPADTPGGLSHVGLLDLKLLTVLK